jgi:hypothetical protein
MNRLPPPDDEPTADVSDDQLRVAAVVALVRAVAIHAIDARAAAYGLPATEELTRSVEQRATDEAERLLKVALLRAGPDAGVRAEIHELLLGLGHWTVATMESAKFPGRG